MNEQPEVQTGPVVKVARDLTEIERMAAQMDDQAEHKANDRIMPGGLAMVMLAGTGSPVEWAERVAADELRHLSTCTKPSHKDCHYAEQGNDEDAEWEPVLYTLRFWSEDWREQWSANHGVTPTIATEANFLRWCLNWAWDNLPEWDDFATDIRAARVRMENVLYAGNRAERTRVECDQCDAKKRRLVKLYGQAVDGSDDFWKCPNCKHRFDADGVRKAHAKMLRSEGAEKWIHQADAIGTLKVQGRSESTIRKWLADGEGSGYCDPVTHEVWVWWPDLWRKHLTTATRNRESA